jgi:glutaredoxin 3
MKAEIYTKTNCPYCVRAKELFKVKGIEYKEYIISAGFGEKPLLEGQHYVSREALLEKAPQAKTVPQIWLEGNYIGGYTELASFFEAK